MTEADIRKAVETYLREGGKVTVGRTRKALNHRLATNRGGVANRGRKQITLRDSQGFACA